MHTNSIIKLPVSELKTAIGGLTKVIPRHSTLPVLGMVHIERDRQGWVRLTGTDLDTFLTFRLETPAEVANSTSCRISLGELQKLVKTCPADEILELEVLSDDKLLLRHRIGSHPVEQVVTSAPVADFPQPPQITAKPVSLDEAARATLLDALACASDDETRVILNGAYLDVSKPSGHYAVATDGRHLYASNSLHLPLPSSVLVPDHRFLSWSGFVKDGLWKLAVQPPTKDKGGYIEVESRRWTFTTKQVEGTYPNWRNITDDVREFTGTIEVSEQAAEAITRIVPRLPGDDTPNHIRVVGDDLTDKFLLLINSHDGTSSLQVKFTPVRVVCQNTLTLAINNGGAGIKISHHTDIHQRLKAAEKVLGIVRHQFDELADTFREMVQVPMTHNRLEKYLQYVYPEPKDRLPTESEAECIARDRSWSEYFFDQGAGNRLRGVEGTLWAAFNGITEYLDHRKIRQSADQRLTSTWFGEANRIKARALTVAVEMLPHFRN